LKESGEKREPLDQVGTPFQTGVRGLKDSKMRRGRRFWNLDEGKKSSRHGEEGKSG